MSIEVDTDDTLEAISILLQDYVFEQKDEECKRVIWIVNGHLEGIDTFWYSGGNGSIYDYEPTEDQKAFARMVLKAVSHDIKNVMVGPGIKDKLPSDEEMMNYDDSFK